VSPKHRGAHDDRQHRTREPSRPPRLGALLAVGAVAATLVAAGPADARPTGGTASKGRPVEHEDGSVTYVPVGTQVGLFKCGSDGEWHFGWLVDHLVQPTTDSGPVTSGTVAPTATTATAIG
jgi:hypothetical protein